MQFHALSTDTVRALQAGGPDAYGNAPERKFSDGAGTPCRHCLKDTPKGDTMLVLAHKPFGRNQPYAETGPIFLCANPCENGGGTKMPHILQTSPDYLLKAYSADERIVYGTGAVVPASGISAYAAKMLTREDIAWVDVRSARNNCYQVRITL